MLDNQDKKLNLAAFYLQNSLYWLYDTLKIKKKDVEFYAYGNKIRIEPKGDTINMYRNDEFIKEYPEFVGFKLILDLYLIPKAREKASKAIIEANKLIF